VAFVYPTVKSAIHHIHALSVRQVSTWFNRQQWLVFHAEFFKFSIHQPQNVHQHVAPIASYVNHLLNASPVVLGII
jgi:hypothetical protein